MCFGQSQGASGSSASAGSGSGLPAVGSNNPAAGTSGQTVPLPPQQPGIAAGTPAKALDRDLRDPNTGLPVQPGKSLDRAEQQMQPGASGTQDAGTTPSGQSLASYRGKKRDQTLMEA